MLNLKIDTNKIIELKCLGLWEYVSPVRAYLEQTLIREYQDKHRASLLSFAFSELLENACKYSYPVGSGVVFKFNIDSSKIVAEVSNVATSHHLMELEYILKRLATGDPKKNYLDMMTESSSTREKSQLGLAKIAFECEAKLSCSDSDYQSFISEYDFPFVPDESINKLKEKNESLKCVTITFTSKR